MGITSDVHTHAHGGWATDTGMHEPGPMIGHGRRMSRYGGAVEGGLGRERRGVKLVDLGMKPKIWDIWVGHEGDGRNRYGHVDKGRLRDLEKQSGWEAILVSSISYRRKKIEAQTSFPLLSLSQ